MRRPNPRVQRTRPYASLRGSPLTRYPLGGWKTRLALGLLSVAALMLPSLAYSCDCGEPPFNPESDVGHAGAVFLGTVTAITSRPVNSQEESLLTDAVTFEASEAWKAIVSKEVIVRGIGWDCDFPFEVGNEYLVFAQRDDSTGDWVVAQCSHTVLAPGARELAEIRAWRKGTVVAK